MNLKYLQLAITTQLVYIVASQNDRSYDTNDWIPVTQKASAEETTQKKATARVLNLDSPSQKFFPDDYIYKKSRPNFQSRPKHKDRYNVPKYENTYKFELPPTLPQNGGPKFQYYPKQEVQLPNYQQPPTVNVYRAPSLQHYVPNAQAVVRERLPLPNIQSNYGQYNLPINNTNFYQTINPYSINQELIGNIQIQNTNGANPVFYQVPSKTVGNQENKVIYQNPSEIIGTQNNQNVYLNQNGGIPNQPVPANIENSGVPTEKNDGAKESVQLVYVPLENLKDDQPVPQDTQTVYRQIESPRYENLLDKQHRLAAIEQDFIQQALQATKLQEQIQLGDPLLLQVSTTPKSIKKRKPHQPPLAVYVEGEKQQVEISDVLEVLKSAKSIAVQDTIQPNSPEIFIGPSTLEAPDYSKFPLPYLNNIDGNRINKNIESLPFFVAPLSFKTPPGFSKIPLPAPHVGSVVIAIKDDLHDKRSTVRPSHLNNINIQQQIKNSPTTAKPSFNTLSPQPYLAQTYYNSESFTPSSQPQLLQFSVNDQNKAYDFANANYNQQISNEYSQSKNPHVNVKGPDVSSKEKNTVPSFQYSYIDEIATGTTPKTNPNNLNTYNVKITDPIKYDIPSRQVVNQEQYIQEDKIPTYVPSYNEQYSNNRDNKKGTELPVQYEPISTTFDINQQRTQEQIVNIKPKAEIHNLSPTRDGVNNYSEEQQPKPHLPDVNPLELAINEFELHQINTQLEEKPRVKNQNTYKTRPAQNLNGDNDYKFDPELHRFSSTPATILRDSYVETTVRPTKTRGRVRTRPPTTTTTTLAPEEEQYTVLEDFDVREKPTPRFSTPSSVRYIAQTKHVEPVPTPAQSQQYSSGSVSEIENIPSNVYSLNTKQNVYTEAPEKEYTYTLNQQLMDQQILHVDSKESIPKYEQQGQFEVDPHSNQYSIPTNGDYIKQQQYNEQKEYNNKQRYNEEKEYNTQPQYTEEQTYNKQEQYTQDVNESKENQQEYTNPLEDPSVRSLLVPNLLVPTTTNNAYTGPSYLPTTERIIVSTVATTERPIETTTTSRVRSRTRGGNKYSENSTTRRPSSRRRPTQYSRVTTERTRHTPDVEYSTRSTSTKQRFRTRGRTTPNSITERLITTENEIHEAPSSEAPVNIRTHPDGSESYMQYDQTINQREEKPIIDEEYSKVLVTSGRPIIQYENTASTSKPILNVQVTHPVETYQQYEGEDIPKVKVRGRIRDRPRVTSTTTEKVATRRLTTSRPVVKEEEEEFYGFFQQPDFGPPPESKVEVTTIPPPPRIYTYQTPSQHREDYQVPLSSINTDTSTVRFVGEIVPKYTTSKEVQIETETPKPRIRSRTRTSQRKPTYNQDYLDKTTKRSSVIRSRGKTHYRLPENLKKTKDEEADVEGGNYPTPFLQGRRGVTTPSPGFQITVAPDDDIDDDQSPHSSIHRPNIVASPEEWHEASIDHVSDDKTKGNLIDTPQEEPVQLFENQHLSSDQPFALPVKSSLEETTTDKSDEQFRKTTQKIEEQFEAINNFNRTTEKNENVEKREEKKKRRKGVWKLVKQRPVDHLEASESQNYFSVLNSFHDIEKVGDPALNNNDQKYEKTINSYMDYVNPFVEQGGNVRQFESTVDDRIATTEQPDPKTTTQDIEKEEPTETVDYTLSTTYSTTNSQPNSGEGDFLDSIYEMFGMSRDTQTQGDSLNITSTEASTEPTLTTSPNPTFPDELTDEPVRSTTVNVTEPNTETTTLQDFLTTLKIEEAVQDNKLLPFQVKPWNMKEVRTSTSTEVSHETEICYKGRCVRSHNKRRRH
ncbi:uncharacterized protein [Diabrotica undecimpunctata]|uniref:uncharacterized protein n=1 Tax=Diabrotica undecimpunctata TaxID=50387 RepID=UPI003B641DC5